MREYRSLNLSVFYRICQSLVQAGWWIDQTGVALEPVRGTDADPAAPNTYGLAKSPRWPWVFLDRDTGQVWSQGVRVYVGGALLDPSRYVVDYLRPAVTLDHAPAGPVTADFRTYTVTIREGYPEDAELEVLDLPIVAYKFENDSGRALGIGVSDEIRTNYVTVDVLARNRGERMDLYEDLRKGLSQVNFYDMTDHAPIRDDGSLDGRFDFADQFRDILRQRVKPRGEHLPPRAGGTQKERYRSLIVLELENVSKTW